MDFTNKSLNKDIPIPLYYQLKEILLEGVKQASAGDSFPTELELCTQFEISRPTVRQAINELVIEGYLTRLKGKGTFISESKITQDFLVALESFADEMQRKGLVPTTRILELEMARADEKIGEALNVPIGQQVIKIRRLRFANETPIVLVVTFLPYEKFTDLLSRDLQNDSLYQIIEQEYGYKIDRSIRMLEARVAGEDEAELLKMKKGDPIQYIETTTYLLDGTPIEFSLSEYRGDRNTFTFELKKK